MKTPFWILLAAGAVSWPAHSQGLVEEAKWASPSKVAPMIARFYPDRATRLEADGTTRLDCAAKLDGSLKDCRLVSEDPVGMGFGDAALKTARHLKVIPKTIDGQAVESQVNVSLNFRLPLNPPVSRAVSGILARIAVALIVGH